MWLIWKGTWLLPVNSDGCERCEAIELGKRVLDQMRASLLERYGLDQGEYGHMAFQSYQPDPRQPSQHRAKAAALGVVERWKQGDWSAGFMLYSSLNAVGVGKSHLAIAAARAGLMLYQPRTPGESILAVWDMPSYVKAIKSSYDNGGTEQIQRSASEPAILVMDDVGAEYVKTQDWYQGLLYDILNARWLNRKATIITTNLPLDKLGQRIGTRALSRLLSLTGKPIEMAGEDYRMRGL